MRTAAITSAEVKRAFSQAPKWQPPDDSACEHIAALICHHLAGEDVLQATPAQDRNAHDRNKRLFNALREGLPSFVCHVHPLLDPASAAAQELAAFRDAATRFLATWENNRKPVRRVTGWAALANAIGEPVYTAAVHANSAQRVGLPRSSGSPLVKVYRELFRLAGCGYVELSAIGKHFTDHPFPVAVNGRWELLPGKVRMG